MDNRMVTVVTMPDMDTLLYMKESNEIMNPLFKKETRYHNLHIYSDILIVREQYSDTSIANPKVNSSSIEFNNTSPLAGDIIQINANLCGIDGNYEACGATLCYSFAKTLDEKNIDLSPLAIAGAIGDKQYIGGIRGHNKAIGPLELIHETLLAQCPLLCK